MRRHQQFQSHRPDGVQDEPMDARENALQKMPQLREAETLGADGTGGDVFDEPASWRIWTECRSGNGSAFGMGFGVASPHLLI